MRTIHGMFITYTFFRWLTDGTMGTMLWLFTFIYNPYEQKQILDYCQSDTEILRQLFIATFSLIPKETFTLKKE